MRQRISLLQQVTFPIVIECIESEKKEDTAEQTKPASKSKKTTSTKKAVKDEGKEDVEIDTETTTSISHI